MKLLNLNIGIKIDNNQEVIDFISKSQYDIITFQESMRKIDDTVLERYNSSNIIKSKTNYKYHFFGPLWVANYHQKNNIISRDFGGFTEQGNEILTNYPIIESSNIFYYDNYSNFTDITNFEEMDHPRAFINAILNISGKKIQIINIHGIHNKNKVGDERTIAQMEKILSYIKYDIPCIVAGDFNLLPNTESINIMNSKLINLIEKYNIKTTRPKFKWEMVCDYIFVNDKIKVNNFEIIDSEISDHLPIILDFDI